NSSANSWNLRAKLNFSRAFTPGSNSAFIVELLNRTKPRDTGQQMPRHLSRRFEASLTIGSLADFMSQTIEGNAPSRCKKAPSSLVEAGGTLAQGVGQSLEAAQQQLVVVAGVADTGADELRHRGAADGEGLRGGDQAVLQLQVHLHIGGAPGLGHLDPEVRALRVGAVAQPFQQPLHQRLAPADRSEEHTS